MIIAAVLIVIAVILAAVGVGALVNARRRAPESSPAPAVSQSIADATQSAATLVAEARTAALHSHEAAMEEVKERLAAVEGREAGRDRRGRELKATAIAIADELAAAADLVRTKDGGQPAVLVSGMQRVTCAQDGPGIGPLLRGPDTDLFR